MTLILSSNGGKYVFQSLSMCNLKLFTNSFDCLFLGCCNIQDHESKYPVLASLARDYLSIPAASAAVERTFSSAADVCACDRGRLSPRSIEELVGCRMWRKAKVALKGQDWATINEILRLACI